MKLVHGAMQARQGGPIAPGGGGCGEEAGTGRPIAGLNHGGCVQLTMAAVVVFAAWWTWESR